MIESGLMISGNPFPNESAAEEPFAADAAIFSAHIVPHRSLSRRGLSMLIGFFGLVGLLTSIPFYLMGAWPVMGFMGLDILLLILAFRYNNATARAYEDIILSRIALLVRKVGWRGESREMRFNPLWARLEREEHPDFGNEALTIIEGRRRMAIAQCLGREERGAFADALQKALISTRRA